MPFGYIAYVVAVLMGLDIFPSPSSLFHSPSPGPPSPTPCLPHPSFLPPSHIPLRTQPLSTASPWRAVRSSQSTLKPTLIDISSTSFTQTKRNVRNVSSFPNHSLVPFPCHQNTLPSVTCPCFQLSCRQQYSQHEAVTTKDWNMRLAIKQYNLGIIEVFFWAISNSLAPLQFKDHCTLPLCHYWPIRAIHSFLF